MIIRLIFGAKPIYSLDTYGNSSKDPQNLLHHILNNGEKVFVVHIVRDIRGYIYSHSKRIRAPKGLNYKSVTRSILEWLIINYLLLWIIKITKTPYILLSYDLFCANPYHL